MSQSSLVLLHQVRLLLTSKWCLRVYMSRIVALFLITLANDLLLISHRLLLLLLLLLLVLVLLGHSPHDNCTYRWINGLLGCGLRLLLCWSLIQYPTWWSAAIRILMLSIVVANRPTVFTLECVRISLLHHTILFLHSESCRVLIGQLEISLIISNVAVFHVVLSLALDAEVGILNLLALYIAEIVGVKQKIWVLLLFLHEAQGRIARLA